MKDPTSLGRYLGEEYFSFAACDEWLGDIYLLEKNSGAKDIWSKDELRKMYRLSSCSMVVVYLKDALVKPVAYMAFSARNEKVSVWSIVVHPAYRLQKLGSKMLKWLARENSKLDLVATVRESDLASQLFFRQCGFTCMKIAKETFKAPPEDGYFFAMRSLR